MILVDVGLHACVSAGSCGFSIPISVRRTTVTFCLFSKADAISHSEAEETTFFNVLHVTWMDPFSTGWALSMNIMNLLRK